MLEGRVVIIIVIGAQVEPQVGQLLLQVDDGLRDEDEIFVLAG